jgi:hypothetical protein
MPPRILPLDDDYILMPPELHRLLKAVYHFSDLDPCPWPRPPGFDGLLIEWLDRTFINPPFTRKWGRKTAFIRKAIEESQTGKVIFGIISSTGGHAINLLLNADAKLARIGHKGRVAWIGISTGKPTKGPSPTLFFILDGKSAERHPGRPLFGDRPMTPAERQARRRALAKLARDYEFSPP